MNSKNLNKETTNKCSSIEHGNVKIKISFSTGTKLSLEDIIEHYLTLACIEI